MVRANFLDSFRRKLDERRFRQLDYVLILFLIITVNKFLEWEISHHFLKLWYLVLGDMMLACPCFWDKLIFYISQGNVGPVLRWSGKYYMGFVENLIIFVTVQKLWKSVHICQSYHQLSNVLLFFQWTTV